MCDINGHALLRSCVRPLPVIFVTTPYFQHIVLAPRHVTSGPAGAVFTSARTACRGGRPSVAAAPSVASSPTWPAPTRVKTSSCYSTPTPWERDKSGSDSPKPGGSGPQVSFLELLRKVRGRKYFQFTTSLSHTQKQQSSKDTISLFQERRCVTLGGLMVNLGVSSDRTAVAGAPELIAAWPSVGRNHTSGSLNLVKSKCTLSVKSVSDLFLFCFLLAPCVPVHSECSQTKHTLFWLAVTSGAGFGTVGPNPLPPAENTKPNGTANSNQGSNQGKNPHNNPSTEPSQPKPPTQAPVESVSQLRSTVVPLTGSGVFNSTEGEVSSSSTLGPAGEEHAQSTRLNAQSRTAGESTADPDALGTSEDLQQQTNNSTRNVTPPWTTQSEDTESPRGSTQHDNQTEDVTAGTNLSTNNIQTSKLQTTVSDGNNTEDKMQEAANVSDTGKEGASSNSGVNVTGICTNTTRCDCSPGPHSASVATILAKSPNSRSFVPSHAV